MDLQLFLKKYSVIPGNFIDDFYAIFENKRTPFLVDLNLASKWIGTRKDHLKKLLLDNYRPNVDFIVTNVSSYKIGRPLEKIYVTTEIFKRLCMRSHTEHGELVRTYYLELEKLVDKYKNYIIEGLNNRIRQLEYNQKPYINTKSGVIYVFKVDEDYFKIGKARVLKNRMKQHNTTHADNVQIVFTYEVDDIDRVESCLKSVVKPYQYRKSKEIYKIQLDTLKEVINSCGQLITKVEQLEPNSIQSPSSRTSKENQQYGGDQTVYAMVFA